MKVMVLFDVGNRPPEDHDYSDLLKTKDWETEAHVMRGLKRLGHDVRPFGIHDDIGVLVDELRREKPDIVFNLCESFENDRRLEPNMAGILELMHIPFTGAGPGGLRLCQDKGLIKKILSYHRIRVPRFVTSMKRNPIRSMKTLEFPVFIKPLGFEGSEGIAQLSFAENEKDCIDRVRFIHEKLDADAIIEEYIDGRELYVGVLGNDQLSTLPARELFFHRVPDGEPKIATFKVKWDASYRKKWGIKSGFSKLDPAIERKINTTSKKIFHLFGIRGYARMDFRLRENGDFVLLEVNPNPSISRDEDFALSAQRWGLEYDQLLERILRLGLSQFKKGRA